MASKRKSPSFEIPDAVRQAGQSGWVYRTGDAPVRPKTTRPSAPLPKPPREAERVTVVESVEVATAKSEELLQPSLDLASPVVPAPEPATAPAPVAVTVSAQADPVASTPAATVETFADAPVAAARRGCALTRYVVSLGLQALVAPIVVPLYLLSGLFTPRLSKY